MNWKKIFIRLSSRSPKDAALHSAKFGKIYQAAVTELELAEQVVPTATASNRQLQALY